MLTAATRRVRRQTAEDRLAIIQADERGPELFNLLDDFWLLPYQRRFIADNSDRIIVEKCRQTGFSRTLAHKAVLTRLCGQTEQDFFYMGCNLAEAAGVFIRYCEWWLKRYNKLFSFFGLEPIKIGPSPDGHRDRSGVLELEFDGNRIWGLPSSAKQFRSRTGDVALDEYAWCPGGIKEMIEIYTAAKPVTTWGGSLHILSTHNALQNDPFSEFCDMGRRNLTGELRADDIPFSLHRVSIYDAVAEGLTERINHCAKKNHTREAYIRKQRQECGTDDGMWAREYQAKKMIDSDHFLQMADIDSCANHDAGNPDMVGSGPLYAGWDFGHRFDWSVFNISEMQENGTFIVRLMERMVNVPKELQIAKVTDILSKYKVIRTVMDPGPHGEDVFRVMSDKFKFYRPKIFTDQIKHLLANRLRSAIGYQYEEDGHLIQFGRRLLIPAWDWVKYQLHAIFRVAKPDGTYKYDAPRSAEHGHADAFWSLAMMLDASPVGFSGYEQKDKDWEERFKQKRMTVLGFMQ